MCEGAELVLGGGFSSNYDLTISCGKRIEFGNDCLLGWCCTLIDGDGHTIYDSTGKKMNENRQIKIGNHVWIAAKCTCLKGCSIADDCVVGFGSILSKQYNCVGSLIIGAPGKTIKNQIRWEH